MHSQTIMNFRTKSRKTKNSHSLPKPHLQIASDEKGLRFISDGNIMKKMYFHESFGEHIITAQSCTIRVSFIILCIMPNEKGFNKKWHFVALISERFPLNQTRRRRCWCCAVCTSFGHCNQRLWNIFYLLNKWLLVKLDKKLLLLQLENY